MDSLSKLLAMFMLLCPGIPGFACSVDDGPSFQELLRGGFCVAVIAPSEIKAPPVVVDSGKGGDEAIQVYFLSPATAKIRIVETVVGATPKIEELEYFPVWCGGHRLEINRFYVLAVDPSLQQHRVKLGGNELLGLGDEYLEEKGALESDSLLLERLIDFRNSGDFNMSDEDLLSFRVLSMPKYELPSKGVRR